MIDSACHKVYSPPITSVLLVSSTSGRRHYGAGRLRSLRLARRDPEATLPASILELLERLPYFPNPSPKLEFHLIVLICILRAVLCKFLFDPVTFNVLIVKMDRNTVPTLMELAAKSLMSNEPAGIYALEVLPKHFFIQLFTTALLDRQKKMLKEIVRVWPFQCLHIGTLNIGESPYDILEAMVDGLQFLPVQNTSSGTSKLKILDLRQTLESEITCYYRAKYPFCFQSCVYSEHSIHKKEEAQHRVRRLGMGTSESEPVNKPIELLLDISFSRTWRAKKFIIFIKSKIEQSSGSLHLCCRNLQIDNMRVHPRSLRILDPACINHLEVNRAHLRNVTILFPHLTHLESLKLTNRPFQSCQGRNFNIFLIWLGKLEILQDLSLSFFGLRDQLHKLLRVLQPQLDTLSLSFCHLSNDDITVLSQSPQVTNLKRLNLSNNQIFQDFNEPFLTLLERVSGTLQYLELTNCQITDSVLSALIGPLSRCSKLHVFSFSFNPISMSALMNFVQHLTTWMTLRYVVYPIPLHCYEQGIFHVNLDQQKLAEVQTQLKLMLKAIKREDMHWSTYPE
ncbi:melanoma antigen preferentially expressed in tumors-like [Sorex araneus]|uniref:melanoma antigen preferentially expressed in tumors-like n=1 Tax=Sorex araneus TaxID=42254 RepID=UPI0003318C87|nr:melanoma antigen preferentially expressed in tumors-like [Sorex araneus]